MKLPRLISLLSLLLALLLLLLHSPTANGAESLYQICGKSNFTANSTYQSNLNNLLNSLTINATNSAKNFGYTSGEIGSVPNQISGLVLCRGDVNSSICSSCLSQATQDVQNLCPYTREATIYYDYCLIRYSNQHFLSSTDQSSQEGYLLNTQNVTGMSITRFETLVVQMMNSTAEYASDNNSIKFGTGMMNSSPVIYGLVQCKPDLSDLDCLACLQDQISGVPKIFGGAQGARILGWRCNIRYEIYPFYNGVSMLKLTPPAEQIAPAPAPSLSPPMIHQNPIQGGMEQISTYFNAID